MTVDSFGATQRSIANRQLIRILSIGFCVSSILHIIAIAGISYLSNINSEEELEITTIERVELEPEISPSIEPSTSISESTSTSSASPAKTAFNTAEKSNSAQFTTTTPKTPQSKPQQPNGLPSATAILTKKSKITPPPKSPPTIPKSTNPPKDRSKVTPKTNRSIPDPNNQQLPPALDRNFSSIDNTPSLRRDNIGEQPKDKPRNNTPKNNKQTVSQPGRDNNAPDKQIQSESSSTNKTDPNTNLGNNNGGNNSTSQKNSSPPSLGSNNKNPSHNNGDGSNRNNSSKPHSNSPTGNNSNRSVTQCVRNCTIKYPDEFQDSDVGKGKISVRVTIDGNGIVSAAEIVRSSENQQLDSFALEATKKMQFNATGEIRIRRIKVNTITNN